MENVRRYREVKLEHKPHRISHFVAMERFKEMTEIAPQLFAISMDKLEMKLYKPIYSGLFFLTIAITHDIYCLLAYVFRVLHIGLVKASNVSVPLRLCAT